MSRLLVHKGLKGVRIVGGTGDKGADIIAIGFNNKRWLVQAKFWAKPVSEQELQETIEAGRHYSADFLVIAAPNGIDGRARQLQQRLIKEHPITVWDANNLVAMAASLPKEAIVRPAQGEYQEIAITRVQEMLEDQTPIRGMVVMATGLGKTFTASEAIRRVRKIRPIKTLILAHTNALVLQLEKAFWPFLGPTIPTFVWTQYEKPSEEALQNADFIFASRDSVYNYIQAGHILPRFDLILIDECHHAHSKALAYQRIIDDTASEAHTQLLGLTATPFLADPEASLAYNFGDSPLLTIDMVYGLRHGFLSQIDYRLFTSNINWDCLESLRGGSLSPKQVNKVFFIQEWDDAIVSEIQKTWASQKNPKAIIFCETIAHAFKMRDMLNSRGFCSAQAIYSGKFDGQSMSSFQKNLLLSDFEAGTVNVVCTVDVFNEGIDVPDVNIVVFNRVTHSRRIFIQQLGRGLRLSPGKPKTLVLDFAQDIRRYAAGLKMKDSLYESRPGEVISIGNKVTFRNSAGEDKRAEAFLRAWLDDVEKIEASDDEDIGVLKFPPPLGD
ncbi:MAG: DEAD/DEAH box helicase family protein [Terrimicrobiaceae bacterium]|nr:DEAD/DEAH box helicase family protein [Terrimicrobiaceae bacterium]